MKKIYYTFLNNYSIPILVIACLLLACIGYLFSANLVYLDEHMDSNNPQVLGEFKSIEGNNLLSINDNTGTSFYYKGDSENNYLLLNNLMFRIVRYNGDGTIRIILNDSVLYSSYNNNDYNNSNAKKLLNSWVSSNFGDVNCLVEEDYDITNYVSYDTYNLINFDGYLIDYVGLLSVREAKIISDGLDKTYLDNNNGMYLGNGSGLYNVWYYRNGKIDIVDSKTKLVLKPVINIRYKDLNGSGSKNDPFTIKEE